MSTIACPFCLCVEIRLVFEADDGLKSYQCHDCMRTFHVTELQMRESEEPKTTDPPQDKAPAGPKKR